MLVQFASTTEAWTETALDSPTMDLAETPCGFSRVGWSATPCTSPAVGFHTTPEMPYANPKVGFPATPKTPCATPANNFSLPRCHGLLRCGTGSIGTSTRRPDHGGKRGEGRGELLHGTGSVGCGHGQIRGARRREVGEGEERRRWRSPSVDLATWMSMDVEKRRHEGESQPVGMEVRAGRLRRLRTSTVYQGGILEAAARLGPQPRRLVSNLGGGSSRGWGGGEGNERGFVCVSFHRLNFVGFFS